MLLGAGTANAQNPRSTEAEARFKEATALAKQGRFEDALVKYVQAYSLEPRASILLGMAIAERELGRSVEATRHLREYLKSPKAQNVDELKRVVYGPLLEQTGHLHVKLPVGVQLLVDGNATAPIDEIVDVKPGPHVLVAANEKRDVSVAKGQTIDVDLTTPPAPALPVSSGIVPPQDPPPPETPQPTPSASSPWPYVGWSLVGAAVVTAGVGVGFVFSSNSAANRRDQLLYDPATTHCNASPRPGQCADLDEAIDARVTRANTARVLFGSGAALLAGGVAILLLKPGTRANAGVAPIISDHLAGLSAAGRF